MGQFGSPTWDRCESFVLFALRELSAFDTRGSGRFQSQLLLVSLLDPLRQIRHLIKDTTGGSGLDNQVENGRRIVVHPSPGDKIATDIFGDQFHVIFGSFQIHFFGSQII